MKTAEFLTAIIPHSVRWEDLTLRLSTPQLPLIQGPFPLLRKLDLWLYRDSHSVTNYAFRELPLLRTVILNDVAALNIVLPWVQLTSLNLLNVYPHECATVLQQTPNLVHCELELYSLSEHDQIDIILPSLKELTLKDPSPEAMARINLLQPFTTPALCSLEIPEMFFGPTPIDSLASFISKSGCKLQDLRITGESSVPKNSYRRAFPLIWRFFFNDDDQNSGSDGESRDSSSD